MVTRVSDAAGPACCSRAAAGATVTVTGSGQAGTLITASESLYSPPPVSPPASPGRAGAAAGPASELGPTTRPDLGWAGPDPSRRDRNARVAAVWRPPGPVLRWLVTGCSDSEDPGVRVTSPLAH
jgi:hypothetical protein